MRQFEKPTRTLTARRPAPAAPAATAVAALAAVLLTGCGTQTAGTSGTSARAGAAGAPTASGSTGPCGAPQPAGPAQDGVRITAVGPACAEYEVTNPGAEPSDITVLFARTPDQASGPGNLSRTVTALAPGATEKGRLDLTAPGPGPAPATAKPGTAPQVKILKVRSVPSAEAPRPDGPCPPSGLRLYADQGDAAMGLRVVGLHLRNCGTTTVALDGYPTLQLLDQGHRPVDGVRLLSGGAEIATGTGADKPPQKIALRPGEGAGATLVWRNTTEAGTPVNVPYIRVRATPGAAPVMVTPELDLGTTGRLGIGAWAREDAAAQAPASRPPAAGG